MGVMVPMREWEEKYLTEQHTWNKREIEQCYKFEPRPLPDTFYHTACLVVPVPSPIPSISSLKILLACGDE